MTELGEWLDARRPAPPAALRRATDSVLGAEDPGSGAIHERLATAALDALRRTAGEPSRRSAAARLLAVDALLTWACEAAAEAGPEELEELTDRLSWDRFEELREEVQG